MDYKALATELFEHVARSPKVPLEEPKEFTRGEMGILVFLHFREDNVTSGDLSEALSVSTGRVATALKSLEKKGLIVRQSDSSDKRRVYVWITDTGREIVLDKHKKGVALIEKMLEKLGEQDAKEFVRLVKKIHS